MKLSTVFRAAVIGLSLAAATLPVQAAGLQFQFGFGTDGFGYRRPLICIELNDSQIRQAVSNKGYHHIFLNVANNHRIQVRATEGDWVYLLRLSTCSGAILEREKLRPA